MINFPDHFLFFYFFLYFKICKYNKNKSYFLFPFLLGKWKIRLAEVCTDRTEATVLSLIFINAIFYFQGLDITDPGYLRRVKEELAAKGIR